VALNLAAYRFGSVDGTESTHGWLAGEGRDVNRVTGAAGQFLLRFGVQSATAGLTNVDFEFQFRLTPKSTKVPGAWTNITTASAVARTGANAVFANGANCTKRLAGTTGTFVAANAGCTADGTSGGTTNDIVTGGCTETVCGIQIIAADTQVGDLVEFRLTRDGGVLLDAYNVVPSLRVGVNILAAGSYDATSHASLSAAVTKISGTLVAVWCDGMSAADLADPTLSVQQDVWGTTVPGSTNPADYTRRLYGPDVWVGGSTGKDGLPIAPGFGFAEDIPEGVVRVLGTFLPSRVVTLAANATVVEQ
jgi:hypothetical protein